MNEKILCGKTLSQQILDTVSDEVENLRVNNQRQPALAVVLVGSDPASQVYVRNKKNRINGISRLCHSYFEDALYAVSRLHSGGI